jgi:hypothetical protein
MNFLAQACGSESFWQSGAGIILERIIAISYFTEFCNEVP